jgi:hypothetical protein
MKTYLLLLSSIVWLHAVGSGNEGRNSKGVQGIKSVNETLNSGSFIVNTGIVPQTNSNGLKPYGLVYDLIINYQVPIKWVIEQTKVKDGTDFTYSNVNYKGGPFIVPAEYIDSTITSRIAYWQSQGVQGVYTSSAISVPVYATLTNFPTIMIDTLSGLQAIIETYYVNAGIPSIAYILGAPSGLTQCFDIWTNPHGDPTWSTHGYLDNFVRNWKGWIWGQCHAVSMLEDIINPSPPNEQLNFLTENGLKCWQSGSCGSVTEYHVLSPTTPYTNYNWTDPEMQYMADIYLATQAGSERWFHPLSTGGWRSTTKIGVSTANGTAPQQGVLAVYGPAFGDTTNTYGRVMYVAGHNLTSGGGGSAQPHKVAAQRLYFNFMLLAGKDRQLLISSYTMPTYYYAGFPEQVSVTVSSGIAPYTYLWTSTVPGYFYDSTAASTYFVPDSSTSIQTGVLRCIVTDACGRKNFMSQPITVYATPLPIKLTSFTADVEDNSVLLKWTTASEINNDYFTLEKSKNGSDYIELSQIDGAGNSSSWRSYAWYDGQPYQGTSYYRLKQTDFNGKSETFPPEAVYFKPNSVFEMSVHPNPFKDEFTLEVFSDESREVIVELVGVRTRMNFSEKVILNKGLNSYKFNRPNALSSKAYLLRVRDENGLLGVIKLLKE